MTPSGPAGGEGAVREALEGVAVMLRTALREYADEPWAARVTAALAPAANVSGAGPAHAGPAASDPRAPAATLGVASPHYAGLTCEHGLEASECPEHHPLSPAPRGIALQLTPFPPGVRGTPAFDATPMDLTPEERARVQARHPRGTPTGGEVDDQRRAWCVVDAAIQWQDAKRDNSGRIRDDAVVQALLQALNDYRYPVASPGRAGEEARPAYDAMFGDDRLCECGHRYYRHFDTYDNMLAIGCKGCACQVWAAPGASERREPTFDDYVSATHPRGWHAFPNLGKSNCECGKVPEGQEGRDG